MIISDKFIWMHFPKCAGSFTEKLITGTYGDDPDVQCDPIDPENVIWHHNIAKRKEYDPAFDVGGRKVICNFRRLPDWILSKTMFSSVRQKATPPSREEFLRGVLPEKGDRFSKADNYAVIYSRYPVSDWIRVEHIEEDFRKAFADVLDLDRLPDDAFSRRVNETIYISDLSFYFTDDELVALYEACPNWAALERELYGDLLID